ncbi:C5a anaphylatoxin chemotactic receptor 1-like [Festucalex cinctus]
MYSLNDLSELKDNDTDYNITYYDYYADNMEPEILPVHVVALTLYALVVLFGIPANAIVIGVAGFKMPPSVPTIFFLNLALADLLCCLSLPLHMMLLVNHDLWEFGPVACKMVTGLFYLVKYCSILQLVLISLDRWLLVARPVWCQNNRTPKYAVLGCVAVWSLALIASIPEFMYNTAIQLGIHEECFTLHTEQSFRLITALRFLFEFLLPFLIIGICHLLVYRRARRSRTRSKRALRVIVAVVLSFFLCWLPLHVIKLSLLVTPRHSHHNSSLYIAEVLTICLSYFNRCLNPLLYVCLGRGFKDSMKRSLCNILHILSEDHTPRTNMSAQEGARVRRN